MRIKDGVKSFMNCPKPRMVYFVYFAPLVVKGFFGCF
jgi:hypothetical protein